MSTPKVSVIIPTYKGATHLGAAIQSVLAQTYTDFELIVVSDASPDDTSEVVQQYGDPRVRYLAHAKNRGADVARHTGLQASGGEIIVFLDQDDRFHPDKLSAHVAYLEQHPAIGFTYNDRFELNYSAETIRDLWRPPRRITLADLVLWFPLAPSDVVLRREWATRMDLLGGTRGAEISHFGQLFLAGCRFGCVERALNYRRYHSGRIVRDIETACASEMSHQVKVFADPRCPAELLALREAAHANLYLYWAFVAFKQAETAVGQKLLGEALRLKPAIVDGKPSELVNRFLINSIDDESLDHEALLQSVFAQLPPAIAWQSHWLGWATAHGFLLKGTRALVWDRADDGAEHFRQAVRLGAQLDDGYLINLTDQILAYSAEFGTEAGQRVVRNLAPYLARLGGAATVGRLKSLIALNQAFRYYDTGDYARVPAALLRAFVSYPRQVANRGALSILLRSVLARRTGPTGAVVAGIS